MGHFVDGKLDHWEEKPQAREVQLRLQARDVGHVSTWGAVPCEAGYLKFDSFFPPDQKETTLFLCGDCSGGRLRTPVGMLQVGTCCFCPTTELEHFERGRKKSGA